MLQKLPKTWWVATTLIHVMLQLIASECCLILSYAHTDSLSCMQALQYWSEGFNYKTSSLPKWPDIQFAYLHCVFRPACCLMILGCCFIALSIAMYDSSESAGQECQQWAIYYINNEPVYQWIFCALSGGVTLTNSWMVLRLQRSKDKRPMAFVYR